MLNNSVILEEDIPSLATQENLSRLGAFACLSLNQTGGMAVNLKIIHGGGGTGKSDIHSDLLAVYWTLKNGLSQFGSLGFWIRKESGVEKRENPKVT